MNFQPDTEIYKKIIESLNNTLENIITLDNIEYFKNGELKETNAPIENEEILYSSMFDIISNIFDKMPSYLENNSHITNFKCEIINNVLSTIISEKLLKEGVTWDFDLKKKFLWITLLHCVKSTPVLIPFLINKYDNKASLVLEEDINGNDIVMHSSFNLDSLIEIVKCTDKQVLFKQNRIGISPIDMILSNGTISAFIEMNLLTIQDLRNYNKKGLNMFHICSILDNDNSLLYLLNHPDINVNDLTSTDCNQNTPGMSSLCISNNINNITNIICHMINSPKFTLEIFSKQNLQNKCVFDYNHKIPFMKVLFARKKFTQEFINNNYQMFINYFKKYNFDNLEELINSGFFNPSVLYRAGENLMDLIIINKSSKILDYLNNNTEHVIQAINDTLKISPSLYSLICCININLAIKLLDLKMIYSPMIEAKYSDKCALENIFLKLLNSLENNEEIILIENLLKKIMDQPFYDPNYFNSKCNNTYSLVLIFQYLPRLFLDMMKNAKINSIINSKSLTECLKQKVNYNIKKEMIMAKLIDKNIMKNDNYELLKYSMKFDPQTAEIIFDNYQYLLEEDLLIDPETKRSLLENLCFVQDDYLFKKIINHPIVTTKIINWVNKNNESILYYLIKSERFEELLSRKDFDRKLLYSIHFLAKLFILPNSIQILKLILNQNDLPYSYYLEFVNLLFNSIDVKYENYIDLIFENEYFHSLDNKSIGRILHFCIKKRINKISNVLNYHSLSFESFNMKDQEDNNLLLNSLKNNFKEREIISHKFFTKEMLFEKNKNNVNAINILGSNFNLDVLEYCLKNKIIDKHILIEPLNTGGTILHKMVERKYIKEAINIIHFYNDRKMLLNKLDNSTNILYQICSQTEINIEIDELLKLGIVLNDFMEKINNQVILFKLFETNFEFFKNLVMKYKLTKEILLTPVPGTIHCFLCYALILRNDFIDLIDIDLITDSQILSTQIDNLRLLCFIRPSATLFKKILDHNNFNNNILEEHFKNNKSNLEILCENNSQVGEIYFSHEKMNKEILYANNMQFLFNICKKHSNILNIVLQRKLISLEDTNLIQSLILTSLESEIKTVDTISLPSSFIVITNSEYFNMNVLKSTYNNKIFMEYILKNQFLTEYLLMLNKLPQEILFETDNFGDPLIIQFRYNIEGLNNILKYLNINNLIKTNKCGQTLLHLLAIDNCFNDLLNLNLTEELYLKQDNFGKIFLDYVIEYQNVELFKNLLNKKIITTQMLSNKDKLGKTIFYKLLKNFKRIESDITCLINNELLSIKGEDGINNLGQIIKYSKSLLNYVLDIPNFNIAILDNIDNKGRTCLMLAAEYNSDNLVRLLNSPHIKSHHMMVHKNLGSCLTKAIRYNPKDVRFILQSNLMNNEILYSRENEIYNDYVVTLNIVQLACKYNHEALMFILRENKNMKELVHEIIGKSRDKLNSLKIAILYQPECVEVLLKSDYGTIELIKETNPIMGISCFMDAIYKQPASFPLLLKYGKYNEEDLKYKNNNPISAINNLIKVSHDTFSASTNFYEEVPLIKYKNEPCDSNHPQACTICSENKANIIFNPCGHKCCVSCSLRITKCHFCRNGIQNRLSF